jgi:two-component system sensor histidine kinase YesM
MIKSFLLLFRDTQKVRIITAAVALMIAAQFILVSLAYRNAREIENEVNRSTENQLYADVLSNLQASFKNLNNMFALLTSSTISIDGYASTNMNLTDTQIASNKEIEIDQKLEELNIAHKKIEKIIAIGRNRNQKSFVMEYGQPLAASMPKNGQSPNAKATIPDLELLEKYGILQAFLKDDSVPVYYEKGYLQKSASRMFKSITKEEKFRVQLFAEEIEGHVVISSNKSGGVLFLLLIGADFFKSIFSNNDTAHFVTLIDRNGQILWTDVKDNSLRQSIRAQKEQEGTTQTKVHEATYLNKSKIIGPYGIQFVYTSKIVGYSTEMKKLLEKYIWLSVLSLVITYFISYLFALHVTQPFKVLSRSINMQVSMFPIRFISESIFGKRKIYFFTMRNKLFILFIVSVLIPVITVFIFYSQFLFSFSRQQVMNSTVQITKQSAVNLENKISMYEDLARRLSIDPQFQSYLQIANNLLRTIPVPNILLSQYPELVDVSYFVLYDKVITARFSSIFASNLSYFIMPAIDLGPDSTNLQWVFNSSDVYNQSVLSLVKKIPDLSALSEKKANIGFLQIVLKESALFSDIQTNPNPFIISNKNNQFLSQSKIDDTQLQSIYSALADENKASLSLQYKKMNGSEFAMVYQPIPASNFVIYNFQALAPIISKNNELNYNFIEVILIILFISFLVAWILSRLLVRPLENLKQVMENVGDGNLSQLYSNTNQDEIGQLVQSYNKMIVQIQTLMNDNKQITEEVTENKLKEQELINLKTKAELSMLQQQINPHFLYNTLEAINMRSLRYGANEVSTMVKALASIFRYSISTNEGIVSLETEIMHTRNYITIQEMRFRDKFSVEWLTPADLMSCAILKFILQPIIENAIIHGFGELARKGKISFESKVEQESLIMEIRDNGIGMNARELERLIASVHQIKSSLSEIRSGGSGGVGLKNVWERLKIFYEGRAIMEIESQPRVGTTVRITIPLKRL